MSDRESRAQDAREERADQRREERRWRRDMNMRSGPIEDCACPDDDGDEEEDEEEGRACIDCESMALPLSKWCREHSDERDAAAADDARDAARDERRIHGEDY